MAITGGTIVGWLLIAAGDGVCSRGVRAAVVAVLAPVVVAAASSGRPL